jgi:hypothetical protein
VNSRSHPRRPVRPLDLPHCDPKYLATSPLESAFTNRDARNPFGNRSYKNCPVSPRSPYNTFKSYLSFASSSRSYCSLLSLFAPRVFHNSFVRKRFRTLSQKCRVSPLSALMIFKSYLRFMSAGRALCSLFSLFAPRAFHNSFAHRRFRTLSKNCRGVPLISPIWNSILSGPPTHSAPGQVTSRESPACPDLVGVTSRLSGLTPSPSADSINLHPADRFFRRQSHPRGGGTP